MKNKFLLAGDIGGTKTELAVYPAGGSPRLPIFKKRYPSQDWSSLEEIVHEFLAAENYLILQASFGVAGPVIGQKAKITNLSWSIDAGKLAEVIGAPTRLLNDMDAIAHSIAHIQPDDLYTLHAGEPEPHGARAIIAPGTGLGEGFLVWVDDHYAPFGSEGGHTDFAPRSALQMRLLEYLDSSFDHVSYERVCSGMGMPNLYQFFKDTGIYPEPDWLPDALANTSDPTPIIVQSALAGTAEICVATLSLFVEILGNEAGNLALKIMATGGVYIAGGIPPRILDWLKRPAFERGFLDKGRFSDVLRRIPLHVVLNREVALMGAAWNAFVGAGLTT